MSTNTPAAGTPATDTPATSTAVAGITVTDITVTPIAVQDPPLLNSVGVHQPYALRAILQVRTNAGLVGLSEAYGDDPNGKSKRRDQGEEGRFRKFTRAEIAERNDNLDVAWLKDDSHTDADDLPEPEVVLAQIREKLEAALSSVAELESAL